MSFNSWFQTFLEEKEIDLSEPVKIADGHAQSGAVCSVLLNCNQQDKKNIRSKLETLDFYNADCTDFLRFLSLRVKRSTIDEHILLD
jgi:hypothetical protein